MKKTWILCRILALALVAGAAFGQVVVIDGAFDPSEWSSATLYSFNVNLPGGGTTPAELYITNDSSNLYVAVRYMRSSLDAATSAGLEVDSPTLNGVIDSGDDAFLITAWATCPPSKQFFDDFRSMMKPCPPGSLCGFEDVSDGGTTDGNGAVGNDGTWSVHEFWHPLASADVLHDMQVRRKKGEVPFYLFVRLIDSAGTIADTDYPGPFPGSLDLYVTR